MIFKLMFCFCVAISGLGAEGRTQKILGGDFATIDEAPWHAIILYNDVGGDDVKNYYYETSGALIRDDLVAVPAWYISQENRFRKVRAGSNGALVLGEIAEIKQIIFHEQFDGKDYNIAVVLLQAPYKLTELIAPIPLISNGVNYPEATWATITGYGTQTLPGNPIWWLKKVAIPLVNHDLCIEAYLEYNITVNDRELCAGDLNNPYDTPCYLDEGGPLVINQELVGLFSNHWGCGLNGDPTIYVDIAAFRDWLQDKIDNLN